MTPRGPHGARTRQELSPELGRMLWAARGFRSQAAVARGAGITQPMLCRLERGTRAPSRIVALARTRAALDLRKRGLAAR